MDTSQNTPKPIAQQLQNLSITFILYSVTLVLGAVACFILIDIADLCVVLIVNANPEIAYDMTQGVTFTIRCMFILVASAGILLVAMVGMEFHLQHLGTRLSYSVLALTIASEIAILLIYKMLIQIVLS